MTTAQKQVDVELIGDRELTITRTFNAPGPLLFEAITQPEHVRQWYGLRRMTMPVCEIDLRPGGKWRYVLNDPERGEFAFSGVYREIVPPERIVSTELFEMMPETEYLVTVTLTEGDDGRTTLRSHLIYQRPEHRAGHIASGMERGVNETYERLEELLARLG